MQECRGVGDEHERLNNAESSSTEGPESTDTDDVESDDAPLTGLVEPSDGDAEARTLDTEVDEARDAQTERLSSWGPRRRWQNYRLNRQFQSVVPSTRDDSKQNELTRLPAEERLETAAVWVTELYPSSTISGLLTGIRALGWEYGRSRNDSLLKWMENVRQGRSAGWINLGLVSPPDSSNVFRERTAWLPSIAKAALPTLISVTPSVTALVISFILTDDAAGAIDVPMRADFKTYSEPNPRFHRWQILPYVLWNRDIQLGRSVHFPLVQRRERVVDQLDRLEHSCTEWVRANLPGAFSAGVHGGAFPTALLFVSDRSSPLTDETRSLRGLEGTSMNQSFDAWCSDEWPAARMTLSRAWREPQLRLSFGCKHDEAISDTTFYHEPTSNWTIAQYAHERLAGLSTRWALSCVLDGYHQRLAEHRDRSAADTSFRAIRDLRQLRQLARRSIRHSFDGVGSCFLRSQQDCLRVGGVGHEAHNATP